MIKTIASTPFLDTVAAFESISTVTSKNKLRELLSSTGVTFYDTEKNFIKEASVSICGFGGLGFDFTSQSTDSVIPIRDTSSLLSYTDIKNMFNPLQATGGFMSYLNTGNLDSDKMISVMAEHGHYSTLHLSYINIAIFGISSLVENEINCQRDMMHIARITEARTGVQSQPPLAVLYPEQVEFFKEVYTKTQKVRAAMPKKVGSSKRDFFESSNSIYSGAKGTGVIISITLKNLMKLISLLDDSGKEEEFKRVLLQLSKITHTLWPHFFKSPNKYSYTLPEHLEK